MTTESHEKKRRNTPSQSRALRRKRRQRRRRAIRLGGLTVILVIALLFIASLFAGSLPISIGSSGSDDSLGDRIPSQGRDHIELNEEHVSYNSRPATSGPHYDVPLAPASWGFHESPLPDEVLVHNLEHGGVGVHYDCPEGCPELINQLAMVVDSYLVDNGEVIMSPYSSMESRITLTAWTFMDKLVEFDEARIRAFIDSRMNSPVAPEYPAR